MQGMTTPVVALYVDPKGPYPSRGVDCWDLVRDATKYKGPHPVIAHPPCGGWGSMRHLHTTPDTHCAPIALAQVRAYGGILEHPRGSKLWAKYGLPAPGDPEDSFGGRTYAVEQVSWGHCCRKPTWLYMVRVPNALVVRTLRTGGEPTHQIWGGLHSPRHRPLKGASAAMRRRTPPLFAEWLISLVKSIPPRANI